MSGQKVVLRQTTGNRSTYRHRGIKAPGIHTGAEYLTAILNLSFRRQPSRVSSGVEQLICNQQVVSSNLTLGSSY